MKISEKTEYAKKAINFITTHDDAPMEEVIAAVDEIFEYAQAQIAEAQTRRAAEAAPE